MRPAFAPLHLVGGMRMVFLVDRHGDAPAADLSGNRHEGMRWLGERRMVVVRAERARLADVGYIDDRDAAVPAARPELVAEAQRVVQAVAPPLPGRLLAARGVLARQPPARDLLGLRRVAD